MFQRFEYIVLILLYHDDESKQSYLNMNQDHKSKQKGRKLQGKYKLKRSHNYWSLLV